MPQVKASCQNRSSSGWQSDIRFSKTSGHLRVKHSKRPINVVDLRKIETEGID